MTPPTAAQIEAAFLASDWPLIKISTVTETEALGRTLSALDHNQARCFIACALGIEIGMRIAREMPKLGATGKFPQGHADAHDEGEIVFAIAADREHGVVRLDFGTPVVWMGLPPLTAKELGLKLMQKAQEVETGWTPSTPV